MDRYSFFRSLLFRLDPEAAHALTLNLIRLAGWIPPIRWLLRRAFTGPGCSVETFGLSFPNQVGLAAGYDKDGLAWRGLACLGFGHIEIGTVTPLPQPGNVRPRLFRLPEDRALINRMGFPGRGAEFVAQQLRRRRPPGVIIGVNLGKNKDTPLGEAYRDYLNLYKTFAPLADYLAINISSPNTIGLRRLQARESLEQLLTALSEERRRSQAVPVLVKLAPDLSQAELVDALDVIQRAGMDGVIAANTTISRKGARSSLASQTGGLSGVPLRARSTEIVRQISLLTGGKLPVIGVGGVDDANSAREKLDAGAALVQVYTGLVYQGPGLVKKILMGLNS